MVNRESKIWLTDVPHLDSRPDAVVVIPRRVTRLVSQTIANLLKLQNSFTTLSNHMLLLQRQTHRMTTDSHSFLPPLSNQGDVLATTVADTAICIATLHICFPYLRVMPRN